MKLKLSGIGEPVFNILKNFQTNYKQHVFVDENFSQFKFVIFIVPKSSVLRPVIFILINHSALLICGMILKIKLFHMQMISFYMLSKP